MLSHKKLTTDGFSLEADGRYIALMNPAVPGKEANARRLVACWNEHDALVHDNARLYESLQCEMQSRIKAEQGRDGALAALEIICDLASMEWQEPDGSRKGAVDNWGERLYFVSKELIEGARAILAKHHKVNHDQE